MGANLSETTRFRAPSPPPKRRFATSALSKKRSCLRRGSLTRDRGPGQHPSGSEATPAARVMVRKSLAAVTEARQLASCSARKERVPPQRAAGHRQTRGELELAGSNLATAHNSGAPQLTLDTISSLLGIFRDLGFFSVPSFQNSFINTKKSYIRFKITSEGNDAALAGGTMCPFKRMMLKSGRW